MKSRYLHRNSLLVVILLALVLLTSTGFTAAQARSSSGPLLLRQVRRIYVAPSFDDFALMIKARLETWAAVEIVSDSEDADAILTCQTVTTVVPAKVAVRQTIAEVKLVDRRFQKPIWTTRKSVAFDRAMLADDIMEQLKQDWRKSASAYGGWLIARAASHDIRWSATLERREPVNIYEVTLHGTDSIYLLASTKYRALELAGDYLADAGRTEMLQSGQFVLRQIDPSEEQILRSERCRACPLNE